MKRSKPLPVRKIDPATGQVVAVAASAPMKKWAVLDGAAERQIGIVSATTSAAAVKLATSKFGPGFTVVPLAAARHAWD